MAGSKTAVAPLVPGNTPNLTPSKVAPMYHLDAIGSSVNPTAAKSFELFGDKSILVMGWAIDGPTKTLAGGVDVVIDQAPYSAHYGTGRTDVAGYYKRPDYEKSGFELTLPPGQLTKGDHSLSIRIISSDRKSYYQGEVVKFTIV
jgi:hypothetical protein